MVFMVFGPFDWLYNIDYYYYCAVFRYFSLSLIHKFFHTTIFCRIEYYWALRSLYIILKLYFLNFIFSIFHEQFFGLIQIILFEITIECIKFIFEIMSVLGSFNMSAFCGLYGIRGYGILYHIGANGIGLHSNLIAYSIVCFCLLKGSKRQCTMDILFWKLCV